MEVHASASFSIIREGVLWGVIACNNETPRSLTYDVRSECRSLVGSLGRWIKAKDEAQGYRERLHLRSLEDDIVGLFSRDEALDDILTTHMDEVSRLMTADGMAILCGRELLVHGRCPLKGEIRTSVVRSRTGGAGWSE